MNSEVKTLQDANDYLLKRVEELKKENARLRKTNKQHNLKIFRLKGATKNEQKSTK